MVVAEKLCLVEMRCESVLASASEQGWMWWRGVVGEEFCRALLCLSGVEDRVLEERSGKGETVTNEKLDLPRQTCLTSIACDPIRSE